MRNLSKTVSISGATSNSKGGSRIVVPLVLALSSLLACAPKAAVETDPLANTPTPSLVLEDSSSEASSPQDPVTKVENSVPNSEESETKADPFAAPDLDAAAPLPSGAGTDPLQASGTGLTTALPTSMTAGEAFERSKQSLTQGAEGQREAIRLLEKAVQNEPSLAEAHYNLGYAYHQIGRYEKAKTSYKAALDLQPDFIFAYVNLASVYRATEDYGRALDILGEASSINPKSSRVQNERIAVLRAAGRSKDAVAEAHALLKENSNDANAFVNLAFAYYDVGNLDMSKLVFEKAFATFPAVSEDHYARHAYGLVLLAQGEREQAIISGLEKSLEKEPTYVPALVNRANLHLEDSENEEAVGLLKLAVETEPMNTSARLMLGVALRRSADYDSAKAQYEIILSSSPDNLDAVYNLGVLYSNYIHDPDGALASFTKAKDLTKDDNFIAQLDGYIQEAEQEITNRDRMDRLKKLRQEAAAKRAAEEAAAASEVVLEESVSPEGVDSTPDETRAESNTEGAEVIPDPSDVETTSDEEKSGE